MSTAGHRCSLINAARKLGLGDCNIGLSQWIVEMDSHIPQLLEGKQMKIPQQTH